MGELDLFQDYLPGVPISYSETTTIQTAPVQEAAVSVPEVLVEPVVTNDTVRIEEGPPQDMMLENPDQLALIDVGEWWENEWQGMPEFIQEDCKPWKQVIVSFSSRDDLNQFAKLVNQRMTGETRSIWYPELDVFTTMNKRYVDEQS